MGIKKVKILIILLMWVFAQSNILYAWDDINIMLEKGRSAIEGNRYEEAVDYLGKILESSGNQSNDDKIVAFGAVVQAYGVWKLSNPKMNSTVIEFLNTAIARDPSWEYPKKLLKEAEGKK